jgi:NhaA family Na+:H+ antiporter
MERDPSTPAPPLEPTPVFPRGAIDRWVRPFARFLEIEAASGLVLLACAGAALAAANSPFANAFHAFWDFPVGFSLGSFEMRHPVHYWINDGLMTVFFFLVGLEIKREFVLGELRNPRTAALPLAAALGGMLVPAGIYLAFQLGEAGQHGWGIPMATDIAFVVGVMTLIGSRVPHGLRIMILTLAIADDIGAVIVIAIAYSQAISGAALAAAAVGFGMCFFFNRIGVRAVPIYVALGAGIWFAVSYSGVHPTVAGVALGFATPTGAWMGDRSFRSLLRDVATHLEGDHKSYLPKSQQEVLRQVADAARETIPPLERLETALHPWVAFGIMPVFALANAGVHIETSELLHPVEIAVAAGLVLGKPLGIVLFSWIFVQAGVARLPSGVSWLALVGGGFLGGIGFTMALFIAALALDGALLDAAKIGILTGSAVAGVAGFIFLYLFLPKAAASPTAGPLAAGGEESP